ncbi:MAG: ABC transporter ATP-binding protein [Bacteroidales bacterium]|nr:ABC transporter ATP-binding protein [Bacteroidales bacterium]
MLLFFVMSVLSVTFVMATALSVSDFLRLLFASDQGGGVLPSSPIQGNLLAQGLNELYVWLIGFGQMKAILLFSLFMLVVYVLKNVFGYLAAVEISVVRAKMVQDIRNDLFSKVMRLPLSYFGTHRKGDMLARFSSDISEYEENIIGSLQLFVTAVISSVIYLAMLLYISAKLTLFVLCMLPIVAFVISGISHRLKRQSKELQQKNAYLVSLMEETIMGLKVIKAYTAIDFSNRRFRQSSDDCTRLRNRVYRRISLASPLSEFLSSVVVIGILLFGSFLIFSGGNGLTPELFISYIMIFVLMIEPIKNISTAMSQIKKGRPCAGRLQEIFDEDEGSVARVAGGVEFDGLRKQVEFHDVSFAYQQGIEVLHDICLTIPKGRSVALVGSSGSGKSTLADLLARFYDVTEGAVLIDGRDIREYDIARLRQHIGIVSQETILFNDTVRANIAFGMPEATLEQVQQAARIANAHDFIMELPQGYDTNIGDGGESLSGGQRQRLSIARAVLRNPDILIMDEATSALDTETEHQVQQALDNVLQDRTALIIAHRLSTIARADEIIVLEGGRIVERGSHASLKALQGRYAQLVEMQQVAAGE